MKTVSVKSLARESGLSREEAARVWSSLELSGFRSWKPWTVLLAGQAGYWPLLLWEVTPHHLALRLLQSCLFMGSLLGSLAWSRYLAYPRMLEEARRRAGQLRAA
jgi:hypothetical protein